MSKPKLFWPLALSLLLADCSTKQLALYELMPHMSRDLLGGWVRFRLTFNTGAAFGVASDHRWLLTVLGVVVLGILAWLYGRARDTDRRRVIALALICGGAMGNLVDRIRWSFGVIDFIDVGWWTFNLADVGITVGALLLVWSLRINSRQHQLRGIV